MAQSLTTETPATEKRPRMSWRTMALHVLAVLLGLVFLASGVPKVAGFDLQNFARFGYPGWFFYMVGVMEVAGGLLVFVPATRRYGAAVIACVMVGAIVTHLKMGEAGETIPPAVLLAMAAVLVWAYRPRLHTADDRQPDTRHQPRA
jgi:uncharacterized membrane protein YphA (DoxX/SURF4 family)